MTTLNVPVMIADTLRRAFGPDLDRAAVEALAMEGYRNGKFSCGDVAAVLGFSTSLEAQRWLAERGVPLNYTLDDLEADRASLARLFPNP